MRHHASALALASLKCEKALEAVDDLDEDEETEEDEDGPHAGVRVSAVVDHNQTYPGETIFVQHKPILFSRAAMKAI